MTVIARVSVVAMVATIGVLAAAIVIGPWDTRWGAICASAGMALGLRALVRARRVEHGDDVDSPSTFRLLAEAMSGGEGLIMAGIAVYVLGVFVQVAFLNERMAGSGGVLGAFVIVGTLLFLAGGMVRVRRSEGVERQQLVEATSVAFLITMGASLGYGTLESFAEVPRPSAWFTWSVGMLSWAVVALVQQRRRRS